MGPPPPQLPPPPPAAEIRLSLRRSGGLSPAPPAPRGLGPFHRWFPWLVPAIFAANVAMFVVTMYVNDCPGRSVLPARCVGRMTLGRYSFEPIKVNPLLGPSTYTLQKLGGLVVDKVVKKHQLWRLITCMWLHAGVVHILANMLSLLFIGIRLEREFGFVRIGFIYVISGFGGSLLSALFIQSSISVGASGALFGLLGSMLSELITNWTIYANKLAALLTLLIIIVINLAVGILPHVDNFTHIGGFISGFFLGFVFLIRPQFGWIRQKSIPSGYHAAPVKHKHKMYQYILLIIAAIFLIVWFTVGLIMLFRGVNGNEHCSWCHYMSCVPTSKWSCKSSSNFCYLSTNASQVTVSCQDLGRNQTYLIPHATDDQMNQLCNQQCS